MPSKKDKRARNENIFCAMLDSFGQKHSFLGRKMIPLCHLFHIYIIFDIRKELLCDSMENSLVIISYCV